VVWYEDWGCVSIESATSPLTKVDEYVAILEAEGIVMTYDSDYATSYGYVYLDSGSYIEIQVHSLVDDGLNFVCDAYYVPYVAPLTEWPSDLLAEYFGIPEDLIPVVEADEYEFDDSYYDYFGLVWVVAYGAADQYEPYTAVLEAAGWTVEVISDDTGESIDAMDPDYLVELYYYVDGEDLIISVYPGEAPAEMVEMVWPTEDIAEFFSDVTDVNTIIPSFEAMVEDYAVGTESWEIADEVTTAPWLYIQMLSSEFTIENTEDVYYTALEAKGFTIDDTNYDTIGYVAVDASEKIMIQFYYWDGVFSLFMIDYGTYLGVKVETAWPTDVVATFVNDAAITVPAASGDSFSVASGAEALTITIPVADGASAVSTYEEVLTAAGWTVTDHVALNAGIEDSKIKVTVSTTTVEGQANLVITIEHYIAPLPNGVFDLSNENQLTTKGDQSSVWTSGSITMTVNKNTATVNVGNTSYYSNPLRLYSGQEAIIASSGDAIASVTLTVSGTSYATALQNCTFTNVDTTQTVVNGLEVTLVPVDGTLPISFVAGGQVRLTGIVTSFVTAA
ncbi:MAG: hypothetical protein LBM03_01920, partial [Erysipelotrichaceae bacterium]|nr:hypothetical protein [Erysipelotrichaceae bacterium]